jgi:hypothetical protein
MELYLYSLYNHFNKTVKHKESIYKILLKDYILSNLLNYFIYYSYSL